MSRVTSGFRQSSRATPGRPLRHFFFLPDLSATFAFCPLEGGSDEFDGVFGGLPPRPSNSAIRARSSSILARSELFCSRRSLFCSKSSSILFSSDSTNPFWLSALSESILSGGIPSLNHDEIPWHRGTQRMLRARGKDDSGVSNYDQSNRRGNFNPSICRSLTVKLRSIIWTPWRSFRLCNP